MKVHRLSCEGVVQNIVRKAENLTTYYPNIRYKIKTLDMKGRRIDWKKSGIYSIICTVNGKQYIGCSTNIYSRINNHKSILNKKWARFS